MNGTGRIVFVFFRVFCVICDFTERKFDKTTKNDCKKSNYMILLSSVDKRPHGQAVKTSPSHGEISGSIPLGATRRDSGL